MNEVDEIKRRMRQRQNKPLNDRHFKKIYNGMIKLMVAIMVIIGAMTYLKIEPSKLSIKNFLLDELKIQNKAYQLIEWLKPLLQLDELDLITSSPITYVNINNNNFSSASNEILTLDKGSVVFIGHQEILGDYIIIQGISGVKITYGSVENCSLKLNDLVEKNTLIGSYSDSLILIFEYDGKEITYEQAKQYF